MVKHRSCFAASLFDSELPRNWELVTAGKVISSSEYGLSEPGVTNGNTPIVGMRDLSDGAVNLANLATIDGGEGGWPSLELRKGDILLNRTNSPDLVGKAGIVRNDSNAVFASYLVRLKVDQAKIDPEYFNYWLNSSIAQRALKRLSTRGVSQANINPTEFKKHCPVALPPINEQKEISNKLRTWDDAIETLAELITKKTNLYKATLTKYCTPCHPKNEGRDASWTQLELGEAFRERNASGDGNDRLLSITMNEGVIDREDVGRKDTSTEDKSKYKLILPGDIGYNTMRMWQGVSGLSSLRGIVSPAYTIVIPNEKIILGKYAAHLFKSRRMVFDFQRYSQGLTSDTWNLKYPAFSKIALYLPPLEIQERQADALSEVLHEMDLLKREKSIIERQKRGLMQKLLTGEWRVVTEDLKEAVG